MAKPLSPAAQAVLDALNMDELNGLQQVLARAHAVAVLHAAADAVSPEAAPHRRNIRAELLAIAAELEEINYA